MKLRALLSSSPAIVATTVLVVILLVPAIAEAKKKPPTSGGGGLSTTSTYVKNYANVLNGVEYDLAPQDVQATSDGGWVQKSHIVEVRRTSRDARPGAGSSEELERLSDAATALTDQAHPPSRA